MMGILDILMIALFIEAIVAALKPLWTGGEGLTVSELVAMGIGMLVAVTCKIDILGCLVELSTPFPVWVQYIFYALTGIAIGRGTNFLYDLWQKLMAWKNGDMFDNGFLVPEHDVDIEITHWSLAQLQDFCKLNGIPSAWCVDREDYIEAIEQALHHEEAEPPEQGGAE